jgi:putative ATP-dependent endonuclease of OLD family
MEKPYISRVEITNFRNFEALEISLDPTAVIVGENQAGKSSFIEALRLVLDPTLPDSMRMLRAEDFWDGLDKPFAGNTIEVKVYIQGFDTNKAAKSVLADSVIDNNPMTALLTYQYRPRRSIKATEATEDQYEHVIFGGTDEKHRVAAEVRRWLAMIVLPALRDAESDMQNWRKSPLRPLLERARKSLEEDKISEIRDTIDEATKALISEEPIRQLTRSINKCISEMVGPVHSVKTQLDFAPSEPAQLIRSIRLYLKEKETRPLSNASLGTNNILFLALLLEDLDEKISSEDLVSAILAIEEPEAHLHPHLQRLLFRHFLNRGHSLIVTTHSPNIASVCPIKSLVLLKKGPNSTEAFTAKGLGLTSGNYDDLQRYLDVTRAEFLFAKGVIFVEGIAEQFLIPAYAANILKNGKMARSLDDLGISVSSVNGTDFVPFRRLLSQRGLSIPSVVVTDGDPYRTKDGKVYRGLVRGLKLLEDAVERKTATN